MIEQQISEAADVIGVTFGPNGKNVLFEARDNLAPILIRDGVKTAQHLAACDPLNTGVRLLVDACNSTVRKAGDGTTTTAILAKSFIENWEEVDVENYLVKGKEATKEQFYQAANISGNGRPEAKLVADLVWQLGPYAHIVPYKALGEKTRVEIKEGYVTSGGLWTQDMMGRYQGAEYTHNSVILKNPLIMLVHDAIHGQQQMSAIIAKYLEATKRLGELRPLVIFGTDINKDAVGVVLANQVPRSSTNGSHNGLPIFLAAGWKDAYSFDDIKKITGATMFSQMHKHLFPVKGCTLELEDLGEAEEIELSHMFHNQSGYSRIKVKDMGVVDKMIEDLKASITPENEEEVRERISKLAKGVGFIYIGGATETEHRLIADSVEDCVISSTTVLKEGVVPGCAYSFYEMGMRASDDGNYLFSKAVYEVREKLLRSIDANEDGRVYNFRTKQYHSPEEGDLWESAAVVNESLKSAYSFIKEIKNVGISI